ncbi:DUF1127 domain-containing protein [Rhizobium puerariae]|uniref:DUF1127 domain-containing protein n=1 Tax=Rhizobium puerariae TaxID=1585791 RepID=A0ABV6AEC0_9HYPH
MRNENRAVFDRVSEHYDLAIHLPHLAGNPVAAEEESAEPPVRRTPIGRLIHLIAETLRRRRNRLALLELCDDQLKDIGLSRSQAYGSDYSRYRRSSSHALERKGP